MQILLEMLRHLGRFIERPVHPRRFFLRTVRTHPPVQRAPKFDVCRAEQLCLRLGLAAQLGFHTRSAPVEQLPGVHGFAVCLTTVRGIENPDQKRRDLIRPVPLFREGHIYWVTDTGVATCVELKSGKVVWEETVFNGSVTSSPVLVAGNVIAVNDAGKAVVFKATPAGYENVAVNDLGEQVFASPAVADGRLYIRGAKTLFCIGKK